MKIARSLVADVIVDQSLKTSFKPKQVSQRLAAYLIDTGRTSELESLLRDIIKARSEHGVVEVIASSKYSLSSAVQQDIKSLVRQYYPKAKTIVISQKLDSSIIGGVRLELPNEQLDLTINSKLNRFKQLTTAGE